MPFSLTTIPLFICSWRSFVFDPVAVPALIDLESFFSWVEVWYRTPCHDLHENVCLGSSNDKALVSPLLGTFCGPLVPVLGLCMKITGALVRPNLPA